MSCQPVPSGLDDQTKILELWLPAKLAFNFGGAGDKNRWISSPSRYDTDSYLASDDFACHINDFFDAIAVATTAEVVNRATLFKDVERENVRARQIDYVNVVAHARSIARWIVVTKDLNVGA